MTRTATRRYVPDNPFQRATALGKRLRVTATNTGIQWTHPDDPRTLYLLHASGRWCVLVEGTALEVGSMSPEAAAMHLSRPRAADPRRLAAAVLLKHGATA
jgi:hypothetical protein